METTTTDPILEIFHTRYEDCDEFMDDLLLEFECYCSNYIHPPIWHCTAGHHFCSDCRSANNGCPTCKETPHLIYQSKVLESFHEKMYFPCTYYLQGCDHRMKAVDIELHQTNCDYKEVVVTQYVDPRYDQLTPEEYQQVLDDAGQERLLDEETIATVEEVENTEGEPGPSAAESHEEQTQEVDTEESLAQEEEIEEVEGEEQPLDNHEEAAPSCSYFSPSRTRSRHREEESGGSQQSNKRRKVQTDIQIII